MTQLNPNAVVLIAIGGISGYLFGATKGCLIGLLITLIFIFFISVLTGNNKR